MAQLITVDKAAQILGISKRTVYKLIAEKTIEAARIGGSLRIDPQSLPSIPNIPPKAIADSSISDTDFQGVQHIADNMSRELQQMKSSFTALERLINIPHRLSNLGIVSIYPPRRISPDTLGAIQAALQRATGEVHLLGIALRGFLWQDGNCYDIITKKLAESKGRDSINIKALILYPFGDAAKARAVAEGSPEFAELSRNPSKKDEFEEAFRESQLFLDIWRSIQNASKLQEAFPKKMKVKAIDMHPTVHMIQTTETMFVEVYHLGKASVNVPGVLIGGCVGEQVPMLQVGSESNLYTLLDASFNHMWDESNPFVKVTPLDSIKKELEA